MHPSSIGGLHTRLLSVWRYSGLSLARPHQRLSDIPTIVGNTMQSRNSFIVSAPTLSSCQQQISATSWRGASPFHLSISPKADMDSTSKGVHEPAPAERRPVNDPTARNVAVSKLQQLIKSRPCVAFTAHVGGSHRNTFFGHLKDICLCSHCVRRARNRTLYNRYVLADRRRDRAIEPYSLGWFRKKQIKRICLKTNGGD